MGLGIRWLAVGTVQRGIPLPGSPASWARATPALPRITDRLAGVAKTPALTALERARVPHTVHAYDHDPVAAHAVGGYGLEAAVALGVEPETVFKTLVAQVDKELVVAICPVTSRVDLKQLARAVGGKRAELADPPAAQRATGYIVGGISPLGQKKRLRTVLDDSAMAHPRVLVSAGRRGLDVSLAPADLIRMTSAVVAPISA